MFKKKKAQTSFREVLKKGDFATKLSFLVMGVTNFANKQWLKRIIFLTVEIGFIYRLIRNGLHALMILGALGTRQQGLVYDDSLGIEVLKEGDNSMLLLLFGTVAVLVCLSLVILHVINLKSARHLYELRTAGKKISTTTDDLCSLLDERFHVTLMTIPLLGVPSFTILPLLYMISIALTDYNHNHLSPKNLFTWVGLINLGNVVTGDMASTFSPVFDWTLIWVVLATATCFFFGIISALLTNTKDLKYKASWRTIFVITMAVPPFVSSLIMRNLLNGFGPINALLLDWGLIDSSVLFPTDPNWAKLTITVINIWIGIPVMMLISTGIIQDLPGDQIEAARIDGASRRQILKSITSPQILFVMTPTLIQQFIGNTNDFNAIYLLIGDEPANSNFYDVGSTDLSVTWLCKLTVDTMDYNLASVISILIFILSAVFSLIAYTRMNSFKEA